jgi:hypothetical protein
MPEISRFYGIVISMYFGDHPHPHVHAAYAGMRAKVGIDPVRLIKGHLPPRALAMVADWIRLHREELAVNWNLCERRIPPLPVEPLD